MNRLTDDINGYVANGDPAQAVGKAFTLVSGVWPIALAALQWAA